VLAEEALEPIPLLQIAAGVQERMAEKAWRGVPFGEQRPQHPLAFQDVLFELVERHQVQVAVRVAVVAELGAGVEPAAQQVDPRRIDGAARGLEPGQYRLTDLPPGTYVLTFSLSGFSTVKRDGLAVSGSGVLPVNVDLRVGGVQETVTVSGEAPVVDTQSVRREVVLKRRDVEHAPGERAATARRWPRVPALNIGGVAGSRRSHRADDAANDVLHRAWRRQRGRPIDDQRPHGRRAVRRRRRFGRSLTTSRTPRKCRCSFQAVWANPKPAGR